MTPSRRRFLQYSATLAAGTALSNHAMATTELPVINQPPNELAKNQRYWSAVRSAYDVQETIVNLEQGYWGQMSIPVEQAFIRHTQQTNKQMS